MIQRIILSIGVAILLLFNVGCREIRSYSHYNGMTKEEIRNMWGEPSKSSNEIWIYSDKDPTKTGGKKVFYFYFKDGVVVNHEAKWWEAL